MRSQLSSGSSACFPQLLLGDFGQRRAVDRRFLGRREIGPAAGRVGGDPSVGRDTDERRQPALGDPGKEALEILLLLGGELAMRARRQRSFWPWQSHARTGCQWRRVQDV